MPVPASSAVAWARYTAGTHSATSHCRVRVSSNDGYVKLEGIVDRIEQSEACSDITKRIKGVKVLENHLIVAEVPARLRGGG